MTAEIKRTFTQCWHDWICSVLAWEGIRFVPFGRCSTFFFLPNLVSLFFSEALGAESREAASLVKTELGGFGVFELGGELR